MRITRFINGNRVTKPLDGETVVKNELISKTIDKVNRRLKNEFSIMTDPMEQKSYE